MKRVLVAGVALRGSGYPNAERTVAILQGMDDVEVIEQVAWLPPDTRLWAMARDGAFSRALNVLKLMLRGAVQAILAIGRKSACDLVYIPYPAPFTAWWLSLVPGRWRPCYMVDAYISLWDSFVRDRKGGSAESLASRFLFFMERRSFLAAHRVLVDTQENARQMVADFGLAPDTVVSLPLAIDAAPFIQARRATRTGGEPGPLRILFFGTLIPLHGIDCLLGAMARLSDDPRFQFRLVGDGQQGNLLQEFLARARPGNVTWERRWMSLQDLAAEVGHADVCLGIFSGEGKASRVLPFKAYYALAAGKAMISQQALSVPSDVPLPPFALVGGTNLTQRIDLLVQQIEQLHDDVELRHRLAIRAAEYYDRYLSCNAVRQRWMELLEQDTTRGSDP